MTTVVTTPASRRFPPGSSLHTAAVEVALAIRAAGGIDALPASDPLRLAFPRAIQRLAGLDRLPLSTSGHGGGGPAVQAFRLAAASVAEEVDRRVAAAGAARVA